jgi:hypothetical protein
MFRLQQFTTSAEFRTGRRFIVGLATRVTEITCLHRWIIQDGWGVRTADRDTLKSEHLNILGIAVFMQFPPDTVYLTIKLLRVADTYACCY